MLSDQQAQRIKEGIDRHSPEELGIPAALWSRRAVRDLIRKECGIDLAERTVGVYLRRWGYTAKKPGRHSRKQDPDEVEQWLEETYPAIEEQAEREGAEILWADEVGVDCIGLGEHHRPDFAISSPEVLLGAIASRTRRIHLASSVTVLSSDDPIRAVRRVKS